MQRTTGGGGTTGGGTTTELGSQTVVVSSSKGPVSGASVTLGGKTQFADMNGRAVFENLVKDAPYSGNVSEGGYDDANFQIPKGYVGEGLPWNVFLILKGIVSAGTGGLAPTYGDVAGQQTAQATVSVAATNAAAVAQTTKANLDPSVAGYTDRIAAYDAISTIASGATYLPPSADNSYANQVEINGVAYNVPPRILANPAALRTFILQRSVASANVSL